MMGRIVMGRQVPGVSELLDAQVDEELERRVAAMSAEHIARLRAAHLRLYTRRLEARRLSSNVNVNVAETERLLELWRSMEGRSYVELSPAQKQEVLDALVAES